MNEPTQSPNKRKWQRGMFLPIALIVVGVVLLALKSNLVARELINQWWPLALVVMGIWLAVVRAKR